MVDDELESKYLEKKAEIEDAIEVIKKVQEKAQSIFQSLSDWKREHDDGDQS